MALEPGIRIGGYRIEGILGRGGMAFVYSARHVELGRHVALKVIAGELGSDPEFVARLQTELGGSRCKIHQERTRANSLRPSGPGN